MAATYAARDGLREYFGTSADAKPVHGVPNGSAFNEMDTGTRFLFHEEEKAWLAQRSTGASGSGSGGVSDHRELAGRDAPGQHPVEAITGLADALEERVRFSDMAEVSGEQVAMLWGAASGPDSGSGAGSGPGVTDHRLLTGRDAADQHPIGAVTGLAGALALKMEPGNFREFSGEDVRMIWSTAAGDEAGSGSGSDAGGGAGVSDHRLLSGRDAQDQHPIEAVTGLRDALAGKMAAGNVEEMSRNDMDNIWQTTGPAQ